MNIRRCVQQVVMGLYAASFGTYIAWFLMSSHARRGRFDGDAAITAVILAALTILPATAMLRGAFRWKRAFRVATAFVLFLWLILPLPQHAVDRTSVFWSLWTYFGVIIIAFGYTVITWRSAEQKPA